MTSFVKNADTDSSLGLSDAAFQLRGLTLAYLVSRAVHVAAELDVADHLRDGAKHCTELASLCGVHAPTLYRLMRMLVSHGVFTEFNDAFSNNALSNLLRSDVPGSLRATARMFGADPYWSSAQAMRHSVRTGEPAFQHVFGEELFSYLAYHPDQAQVFDEAMVAGSALMNRAILDAFDFSGFRTLVDVAGGYGSTLCAILKAHESQSGILFDLPHLAKKAEAFIASKKLSNRCTVVSGSFLESVPKDADAYFMKHILHDWDDERCLQLLGNCRQAMSVRARLLVCEKVLPAGNDAAHIRKLDLVMLLNTPGGRERTEPEYRRLFDKSGLRLIRTIPTKAENSILEIEKA
jgi:O-methyltransferase domain